jgi:hypothetical protein
VGHIYKLAKTLHVVPHGVKPFQSFAQYSPIISSKMRSSTRLSFAALQFLGLVAALPGDAFVAPRADAQGATQTYDYVIVGGGLTGLIVANRLSEDRKSEWFISTLCNKPANTAIRRVRPRY